MQQTSNKIGLPPSLKLLVVLSLVIDRKLKQRSRCLMQLFPFSQSFLILSFSDNVILYRNYRKAQSLSFRKFYLFRIRFLWHFATNRLEVMNKPYDNAPIFV